MLLTKQALLYYKDHGYTQAVIAREKNCAPITVARTCRSFFGQSYATWSGIFGKAEKITREEFEAYKAKGFRQIEIAKDKRCQSISVSNICKRLFGKTYPQWSGINANYKKRVGFSINEFHNYRKRGYNIKEIAADKGCCTELISKRSKELFGLCYFEWVDKSMVKGTAQGVLPPFHAIKTQKTLDIG
jgi:hypothetical protein